MERRSITAPEALAFNDQPFESLIFLRELIGTVKLKGIETVVLYAHAPCGKAYAAAIPFGGIVELLIEARTFVKENSCNIPLKIACFCQIDHGDKKRSYYVSVQEWERQRHKYRYMPR